MNSVYNLVKSYVYSIDKEEAGLLKELHEKKYNLFQNPYIMNCYFNSLDSHGALILLSKQITDAFVTHIYNTTSRKCRISDAYEISPYDINMHFTPIATFNTYWNLDKPNSEQLSRALDFASVEPLSYMVYIYSLPCEEAIITKDHPCFQEKYLR